MNTDREMKRAELMDDEIDLLELWKIIWLRKWMVIIICSCTVILTMLYSLRLPKIYKAETTVIASTSEAGGLGATLSSLPFAGALAGAGIQTPSDKIMVILKSRTTAEAVIQRLDLLRIFNKAAWDQIRRMWKQPDKPPLMEDAVKLLNMGITKFTKSKEGAIVIAVEWTDPKLAADIANYYVAALTDFLKEKAINTTIQVVDKAVPPARKFRPKIKLNMMIAGVTSLFIGVFIVFFLEYVAKQKAKS